MIWKCRKITKSVFFYEIWYNLSMNEYKLLKKYINDPDYEEIKKSNKLSAKLKGQYFDLQIKPYKGKGDDIKGIYYHITQKMINTISDIENIQKQFMNLIMTDELTTNIIFSSSLNDYSENKVNTKLSDIEVKSLIEEIRYSNIIEGEEYKPSTKKEHVATELIIEKIINEKTLYKHISEISMINDLNGDVIRNKPIGVYRDGDNSPLYSAINHDQINSKLKELSLLIANDNSLIDICFNHIIFELIHPLKDGNGRFGRYLITNELINNGIVHPLLSLNISKTINQENNKKKYYKGFEELEDKYNDGDCTIQIENLLSFICESMNSKYEILVDAFNNINSEYNKFRKDYPSITNTKIRKKLLYLLIAYKELGVEDIYLTRLRIQKTLKSNKTDIENNLQLFVDNGLVKFDNDVYKWGE